MVDWDVEELLALPRATDHDHQIQVLEAARCPACRDYAAVRVLRTRFLPSGSREVRFVLEPHEAPGCDVDLLHDLALEAESGAAG